MSDVMSGLHIGVEKDPNKMILKVKIRDERGERPQGFDNLIASFLLEEMRKAINKAVMELAEKVSDDEIECKAEFRE
jgi:hypothetical protein